MSLSAKPWAADDPQVSEIVDEQTVGTNASLELDFDRAPLVSDGRRRIQTILLATDLSPVSDDAADEAIRLAQDLSARLLIVNVIDERVTLGRNLRQAPKRRADQVRADRERPLLAIVETARSHGVAAEFLLWSGEPGQGIVAAAESEKADLIVVGTRALPRAGRFILGSVSDYVVNNSPCPVLIAR